MVILLFLTPIGIFLPMVFNAGDAWGEWSAETVETLIGYVPQGLQKYSEIYQAPMPDYTLNTEDSHIEKQSLFYILSGIIGATLSLVITWLISKSIIRK